MEIKEIVDKLNGSVYPTGDENLDSVRSENLIKLIELADRLISDIHLVASTPNNGEKSMIDMSGVAEKYLKDLEDELSG